MAMISKVSSNLYALFYKQFHLFQNRGFQFLKLFIDHYFLYLFLHHSIFLLVSIIFTISYSLFQNLFYHVVLLLVNFVAPVDTSSMSVFVTLKNLCFSEPQEHFLSNFKNLVVTLPSELLLLSIQFRAGWGWCFSKSCLACVSDVYE